jgi:hypothetical protein
MLVFFSSYSQMDAMISDLKKQTYSGVSYWTLMERVKKIFVEPKSKIELPLMLTEFDGIIRKGNGAAFFAVCRGKISEGIDLPDSHCRAVFLCGIPYSPPNDPRVILKKHFLSTKAEKDSLSPEEWYKLEGLKAVNQAIGRVIRHKDDFGIIVLADIRFTTVPKSHLSAWIRPGLKIFDDPKKFFDGCERFFTERGLLIKKSYEKLASEIPKHLTQSRKVVGGSGGSQSNLLKQNNDNTLAIESLKALYGDENIEPSMNSNFKGPSKSSTTAIMPSSLTQNSDSTIRRPKIKVTVDTRKTTLPNFKASTSKVTVLSSIAPTPTPSTMPTTTSNNGKRIIVKSNKNLPSTSSSSFLNVLKPTVKEEIQDTSFSRRISVNEPPAKKSNVETFEMKAPINIPEIMAAYKKKMNKLPKSIKDSIVQAQRKYATTSLLSDIIPSLEKAIPYDSEIFTDFYHFASESNKPEFEKCCRSRKLYCKK